MSILEDKAEAEKAFNDWQWLLSLESLNSPDLSSERLDAVNQLVGECVCRVMEQLSISGAANDK